MEAGDGLVCVSRKDPLRSDDPAACYTGGTVSAYTTQSPDTTPDAERRQVAIWRRMTGEEKLRLIGELCDSVRYLAELGLRERYPGAPDNEIRMRL